MSTGSIASPRALRQNLAKVAIEKETSDDKVLSSEQAYKMKSPQGTQKHGRKRENEGLSIKNPKNNKTQKYKKTTSTSNDNAAVERLSNLPSPEKSFEVGKEGGIGANVLTCFSTLSEMSGNKKPGQKVEYKCDHCDYATAQSCAVAYDILKCT